MKFNPNAPFITSRIVTSSGRNRRDEFLKNQKLNWEWNGVQFLISDEQSEMPKAQRKGKRSKAARHSPLGLQLAEDAARRGLVGRGARAHKQRGMQVLGREDGMMNKEEDDDEEDGNEEGAIPVDMSRKILVFAREQLEEERQEQEKAKAQAGFNAEEDEDDDLMGELSDGEEDLDELESEYFARDEMKELQVDAEDERALEAFMNPNRGERRTLADIIMEKIKEKEARAEKVSSSDMDVDRKKRPGMNPRLVQVYQSIGKLLSRYRAGRVPKAFKIIPALRNWEEVLYHTSPHNWSPQAVFVATRLFASNLNPQMAQRFYALILLPAVRDDIAINKKLNFHYYRSLKKALFKPAAFFKGILLPLVEGGDCTLREGTIIGSVLAKVSIPMVHSAAAMLKMASMPYQGATSLFLRVLLDKKYSLPYKVIDGLVHHFLQFKKETRRLPVLWHQSLLVFAQRYKETLAQEQKDALKPLLKHHFHYQITPEIRRELFQSSSRSMNLHG